MMVPSLVPTILNWKNTRDRSTEITTQTTSKMIFILEKLIWVVSETAFTKASPELRMTFAMEEVGDTPSSPCLVKATPNAEKKRLAYWTAAGITIICMVGVFLARGKIGVLFGASADANIGVMQYLPYFLAPLLLLAFVRITTSYFYATEKTILSYLLVYAEPVCTLLFLLVLPVMMGITGVWLAVPSAQVVTFLIAWIAKRRDRVYNNSAS